MNPGLLIDSHLLVWILDKSKLSQRLHSAVEDAPEVLVSAATIWELRLKNAKGKLKLPPNFETAVIESGFVELPVLFRHAKHIQQAPGKDPFDRLLLAQAMADGLQFATADKEIIATGLNLIIDVR